MENKRNNLKKKDISKNIYLKFGITTSYAEKILDDTIEIFIQNLKDGKPLKIKNFGSFKILKKKVEQEEILEIKPFMKLNREIQYLLKQHPF